MKKLLFLLTLLSGFLYASAQQEQQIKIATQNSTLILNVGKDNRLYQEYFGAKFTGELVKAGGPGLGHMAYATYGTDNLFEPAIRVTHNDGNPSLELQYVSSQTEKKDEDVNVTHIKLKDPQYPVEVTLHLKAFFKEDVIEQWVEIVHQEKKPVTLYNYASSMLNFDANHYWLTQFHGDWASEMKMQESELTSGIKVIDSKLGSRAHMYQTPVFFLSLNQKSTETEGELIAGTLGWSGNFKFLFEIDERGSLRIISGINPFASEYNLAPGKSFLTPSFIYTYSNQGKGQASRNLHSWAIKYGIMDGDKPRLTLLNNWETTYFDFDEAKLKGMLDDTKKLGVDMFLLDDGWFGNKYPRNNDNAGLGDWQENKAKLPNGIGPLVKQADETGVKFGIWIEPEMVNPKSELYETHPTWVLKLPNRPENYYRNQLVLDLTNPEVQDFIFKLVDDLMVKNPGLAFFKWDCNRMMTNAYSAYLKNEQSQLYVEYVRGLYKVMERIRAKYPHLPMMLCSGGGGRVDYGALKYFTEFWASDNTDPLERIYIQWGYSNFFPAIATCNHITSWGKQPIKFRTDVAMMGKMGYDIQVKGLSEKELKFSQDAISNYKRLQNVIWHGDLFRLISPYDENRAVLMYVTENKSKAVLFSYTTNTRFKESFSKVKLQGLDPNKVYKVTEINKFPEDMHGFPGMGMGFMDDGKSFTGDYLMKVGLDVSSPRALSSMVLEISE